ncbi:MAG: hypothetical protein ABGZ17_19560, partial [Planctomycetaceae bacterium]
GQTSRVCLTWLEPVQGHEQAHCLLDVLSEKTPFVGPFVVAGGRLWAFYGRSWSDGTRDLLELVPGAQRAELTSPSVRELTDWNPSTDEVSRLVTDRLLPGWALIAKAAAEGQPRRGEYVAEFAGERDVLLTRATPQMPVRFLKWIDVPQQSQAQLRLRVGHRPGAAWQLVVRVAGQEVLRQVVDDTSASGGWLDKQLNLTDHSGRRVCVSVSQTSADSKLPSEALWKLVRCSF